MRFETASKFIIVFVRLILGNIEVHGFTRPRREIDIIIITIIIINF